MSPLLETLAMTALGGFILIGMRLAVYSAAKHSGTVAFLEVDTHTVPVLGQEPVTGRH